MYREDRGGQGVFGFPSVGRGTESRVAPGSGPGPSRTCVLWVQRSIVPCLLVANQSAERRGAAVNARLPPGLPIDFIAAHEHEMDAGGERCLHVGACRGVPIFVMAGGREDLVLAPQRGKPRNGDNGQYRTVVDHL